MHTCPNCGTSTTEAVCPHCTTPIVGAGTAFHPGGFLGSDPNTREKPPRPRDTPSYKASRRISVLKELKVLLRQGLLVLVGDKRNLIISLAFPFIAAIITVWIAGAEMFVTHEDTKSACFILVCAAIWGGLFNSIQSIVKERDHIKRDYVSGAIRIECYMGSRVIIQFVLCAIQSLVLTMSIPAVTWVYEDVTMPTEGLLGSVVMVEFYLSIFLIMFSSDAMGLLISSIVKKDELASKLAPYILIAQLLFSGVLFTLEGGAKILSAIMVSRWGMEALGSICDLNNRNTGIFNGLVEENVAHIEACPVVMQGADYCECANGVVEGLQFPTAADMYEATGSHLLWVFLILFLFTAVSLVAADLLLHKVKTDGRD